MAASGRRPVRSCGLHGLCPRDPPPLGLMGAHWSGADAGSQEQECSVHGPRDLGQGARPFCSIYQPPVPKATPGPGAGGGRKLQAYGTGCMETRRCRQVRSPLKQLRALLPFSASQPQVKETKADRSHMDAGENAQSPNTQSLNAQPPFAAFLCIIRYDPFLAPRIQTPLPH